MPGACTGCSGPGGGGTRQTAQRQIRVRPARNLPTCHILPLHAAPVLPLLQAAGGSGRRSPASRKWSGHWASTTQLSAGRRWTASGRPRSQRGQGWGMGECTAAETVPEDAIIHMLLLFVYVAADGCARLLVAPCLLLALALAAGLRTTRPCTAPSCSSGCASWRRRPPARPSLQAPACGCEWRAAGSGRGWPGPHPQ